MHWGSQKCKCVRKSSPDEILEKCNFVQCGFLACVPLCLGRGLLKVQKKGSSSSVQLCHNCQFLSQKNGQSCINGNVDRIKCNHSMAQYNVQGFIKHNSKICNNLILQECQFDISRLLMIRSALIPYPIA